MLQNQLLLAVLVMPFLRSFCVSSAKLMIALAMELHIGGLLYEQVNVMRSEERKYNQNIYFVVYVWEYWLVGSAGHGSVLGTKKLH